MPDLKHFCWFCYVSLSITKSVSSGCLDIWGRKGCACGGWCAGFQSLGFMVWYLILQEGGPHLPSFPAHRDNCRATKVRSQEAVGLGLSLEAIGLRQLRGKVTKRLGRAGIWGFLLLLLPWEMNYCLGWQRILTSSSVSRPHLVPGEGSIPRSLRGRQTLGDDIKILLDWHY